MTKEQLVRKLTSRKFWITVVSNIIGIASLLTASDNADVQMIASIVLIVCTNVAYILGESKVDAVNVAKSTITMIEEIQKILDEKKKEEVVDEKPVDVIETSEEKTE